MKHETTEPYIRQFADARAQLPGSALPWLTGLRENAIGRFAGTGFPTRKVEAWKFTDLRPLTGTTFAPTQRRINGIGREAVAPHLTDGIACHLLVFVDGYARPDLSDIGALPAGARLLSLAEALNTDPESIETALGGAETAAEFAPVMLNTAFMADGVVLALDRGVALERPVHLIYVASGADMPEAAHLRNLVTLSEASSATLIETYVGGGNAYWTNAVTDIAIDSDASLRHIKIQAEGGEAFHLAATRTRLAKGSTYDSFVASGGARLGRNEIAATVGVGADCRLGGVYLGRGRQHLDNTTLIDHAEPDGSSNEHYRGVLGGAAHGVFQGKIVVRPDAQRTDAHQLNKNLLLSDHAQVDTKPELEIYADDVKCSHGATAGELDADALFYLRARGLDAEVASQLLVEAFVEEIIGQVNPAAMQPHLRRVVTDWLPQTRNQRRE
jgi:Fe-S cluster assembly protein SufD